MPEPLKNQFGADVPVQIATMIEAVYPQFETEDFIRDCLIGYDALELTPRGWQIAHTLRRYLPKSYEKAVDILISSLGSELESSEVFGMAPFVYLPHVFFVAEYGLEHFEVSMNAQYELTKRFTAEFSIRPYLIHHQERTLKCLQHWIQDENVHVRRLVSEGTRPRLPWAPRLKEFQKNPKPVLQLLEMLKDDPELYVRRSVANNLNDIGKDNLHLLVKTTKSWLIDASDKRKWVVKHALRSAIKRAEPEALAVLGYGQEVDILIEKVAIQPNKVQIGDSISIEFTVKNPIKHVQNILIDLRVHFIKANGKTSAKTFKLKTVELKINEEVALKKKISFKEMTTRKHYPGTHKVEALINGKFYPIAKFELC